MFKFGDGRQTSTHEELYYTKTTIAPPRCEISFSSLSQLVKRNFKIHSDNYKIIPQESIPTKFQAYTIFGVSCRGGWGCALLRGYPVFDPLGQCRQYSDVMNRYLCLFLPALPLSWTLNFLTSISVSEIALHKRQLYKVPV